MPTSIDDYEQKRILLEKVLRRTISVVEYKSEDSNDKREVRTIEEAHVATLSERIIDSRSYRDLREKYARRAYLFLCTYTVVSFLLIIFSGFGLFGFKLDSNVLSVVAGSTAVSAIGLVHQVIKGLFGSPNY